MALVLGLPLQPDDEVLADLPEQEKSKDPLFHAKILRTCSVLGGGFREFAGEVVEIEVGTTTGDRLYRVRYSDGDLQHFTAEEVRACIPPQANGAVVPAGVAQQAAAARLPERQAAAEEEHIQEAVATGGVEQEVELGLPPAGELPGLEGEAALDDTEEDLNLIILEEDIEVDPLDALLEDAKAAEEAAAESELIDGYLGVEDPEEEPPAPTPAPLLPPARGGPGVQREIVKKGRAKMKAMAKFGGKPAPPVEEEEECEEAT